MTTTVKAIKVGERWLVLRDDATLTEEEVPLVKEFTFEHKPANTGSLIRTLDQIDVQPASLAYPTAYAVAYAAEHCTKITAPEGENATLSMEAPTKTFLEDGEFPANVLLAFVFRVDPSRRVTDEEIAALKKTTPSPSGTQTSN